MKRKKMIHEIDSKNDIKYRGPLTYQHFRIAGWILIAVSQIAMLLTIAENYIHFNPIGDDTLKFGLEMAGSIATPLLLIANIAVIISARAGYKKTLIKFGALSGAAIAVFLFIYERYIIGIFSAPSSRAEAYQDFQEMFSDDRFLAFNIFLDLFLLTLVMFFLNYRPKKCFQGKSIIIFRLFVLIPIAYEALSITLKILSGLKIITIPVQLFPFLTTKPPVGFAVFVALALFIKRRERKFLKNGKTPEQYKEFLNTNSNSLHFSIHAAVIMVIAAVVDILIVIAFALVHGAQLSGAQFDASITESISIMLKCGFGGSTSLLFIAPFMLLFSYNRTPKYPKLDKFIPIVGIVLVFLVYLEGLYQLVYSKFAG